MFLFWEYKPVDVMTAVTGPRSRIPKINYVIIQSLEANTNTQ